jgi:hypothetical protein
LVYYPLTGLAALIAFVAVVQGTRMLLAPKGSDFSLPKPVFVFGILLLLGGTGALFVGLMVDEPGWLSLALALGGGGAFGGMYLLRRRVERPVAVPAYPRPGEPQMAFVTIAVPIELGRALGNDSPAVLELGSRIVAAVGDLGTADVGAAGHEVTVSLTGADADRLFAAVAPVIRASQLTGRAWALLRYGGLGTREVQVGL